ncbi:MAG: ral secretion pathway protein [Alphaproteobacteria bacterium]|nr:ral secretion pathway protein [Alphaproteobacteria bacterium]
MNPRAPKISRRRDRDGFIVVAVLWILAALATLASIYAVYVSNTAAAASVNDDRIRAGALVSAAVELTAFQLTLGKPEERRPRGTFTFRIGTGSVAVEFRSEAARIDLNAAPKELLAGLFAALGASQTNAEAYAERIVGWRTLATGDDLSGTESSAYRTAGIPYRPRQGPFAHVSELWLVMGIPPVMVERALPFVTVFSGRADVSLLDAEPQVLAALPGMTPERLGAILRQRNGGRQDGGGVLGGATSEAPAAPGDTAKATRVKISIVFDNGRRLNAAVVILLLEGADDPYYVLSWRDDADGPMADDPPVVSLR